MDKDFWVLVWLAQPIHLQVASLMGVKDWLVLDYLEHLILSVEEMLPAVDFRVKLNYCKHNSLLNLDQINCLNKIQLWLLLCNLKSLHWHLKSLHWHLKFHLSKVKKQLWKMMLTNIRNIGKKQLLMLRKWQDSWELLILGKVEAVWNKELQKVSLIY